MSNDHKKGPGGHYSGANPIPNIQRFVESLDKDKKQRDAKINEQMKAGQSDVTPHKQGQPTGVEGTRKTVTDPTTGRQVQIEDVNANFMKAVDNPQVGITCSPYRSILIGISCRYQMPTLANQVPSLPPRTRLVRNINVPKTLPLHQTQSNPAVPLMSQSMGKKPISCSIRLLLSAMSLCMRH
jgi:hypothetical protein